MKLLLILSTAIALTDSSCPAPPICPCGNVRELILRPEVKVHPGGSGCYLNLSCSALSYAESSDKTSNLPIPDGYEIESFASYNGDNLMDAFGIVCKNKTWYITKFPDYMNYYKIGENNNLQMDTYEWEGKGYEAVLGGFSCSYNMNPIDEFVLKSLF